jgi:hypothetical protein
MFQLQSSDNIISSLVGTFFAASYSKTALATNELFSIVF